MCVTITLQQESIVKHIKKGNNIEVDLSLSPWHHRIPIIIAE